MALRAEVGGVASAIHVAVSVARARRPGIPIPCDGFYSYYIQSKHGQVYFQLQHCQPLRATVPWLRPLVRSVLPPPFPSPPSFLPSLPPLPLPVPPSLLTESTYPELGHSLEASDIAPMSLGRLQLNLLTLPNSRKSIHKTLGDWRRCPG